jgi:DNA-binding LytR/AlgR family response regulator
VDYLLKPVTAEDLKSALEKFMYYFAGRQPMPILEKKILLSIREMITNPYKHRFLVKVGEHIKSIEVEQILYFYSLQKGTYMHTIEGRNYVIDFTLDALTGMLDPERFFRINRRYLISHQSIQDMVALSAGKLKVILKGSDDPDIHISRDRLPLFKTWLDR